MKVHRVFLIEGFNYSIKQWVANNLHVSKALGPESAEGRSPHNPALMPCPLQGTFPFIIEHLIYVFCYGPTTGRPCAK